MTAAPTAADGRALAAGPLDGLRVVEVGALIAGPFAGRLLGDMGADVIKVEAPGQHDALRDWGQAEQDGHHFFWTVHGRNKRCVTLDLRREEGQELFRELVVVADVVIENFRPGTLERWNLGYDVLSEVNPGLVLARVSGYGQTGPYRERPGFASVAEAVSGLRYVNGYPDRPPPRLAISLGDSLAGMFAVQGIQSALLARHRTGRGQVVDAALTESCLAISESIVPDFDRCGVVRAPSGTRLDNIAPSNIYLTADDQWFVIAANQDSLFARLCSVMGEPELAHDPRFVDHVARGRNQDELDQLVGAWARTHDSEALEKLLVEGGVVCGRVNSVREVVEDPQLLERGALVEHWDDRVQAHVLGPGIVPQLSDTPGAVRWAGPAAPGMHNDEVYGDLLGVSAVRRASLHRAGVI